MDKIIQVKNLEKNYKQKAILKKINFAVKYGELFSISSETHAWIDQISYQIGILLLSSFVFF